MKSYRRLMLGRGSNHAAECVAGNFIGVDFNIHQDLSGDLADDWRVFNKKFIPFYMRAHPDKSKVAAGLACGALWTVIKGLNNEDVVICPDGEGRYRIGEVAGNYYYSPGKILPHRRPVRWLSQTIDRASMSESLQNSTSTWLTISDVSKFHDELERLISGSPPQSITTTDNTIEDPSTFAMETHLEDFLVQNWAQTELGKEYDIYSEDGELVGKQFPADNRDRIDVLAISKDKKTLLVVELKRGRASDVVVGQILRYMGYVHEELAEDDQTVKGIVIALDNDPKLRRAIAMVPSISFYRYQVSFKLIKA